ncbi:MAG TPA: hypothetical protein DD435_10790 [Cyanobacteria bacterium UBA8530]|nr:hypothetical protein [Cyanobacteria bacterium UBA8530]
MEIKSFFSLPFFGKAKPAESKAPPAKAVSPMVRDSFQKNQSYVGSAVNQAIARTQQGCIPVEKAITYGSVEEILLNDTDAGDECLDKVIDMLPAAKREICIQTYLFKYSEDASKKLLDALAEKQKSEPSFEVHFAINGDTLPFGDSIEKALARHGVKADVALYCDGAISRAANHSKIYILDGNTAVVGGDNIDNPAEADLMVKVRGPVVDSLLTDFDNAWKTSRRWVGGDKNPPLHRKEALPASDKPLVPMTLMTKRGVDLVGDYYNNDADQGFLAAMMAAKKEIHILSPNLNDVKVLDSIKDAVQRGVKVKVVVPKDYGGLGPMIDRASNSDLLNFWAQLPDKARDNFEMRWFSSDGEKLEANHTKYMSIDETWSYVGSQNMDNQSWSFSREVGIGIDDPAQAKKLEEAVFQKDWEKSIPAQPSWINKVIPQAPRSWLERLFM